MINERKIWIAVRKDLEIPPGKLAVQISHAVAVLIWRAAQYESYRVIMYNYMTNGQPKIVLGVKNQHALERMEDECGSICLNHALITDSGRTVFSEPTITVCGVGPCFPSELPRFVQRMQLL